jgi:iron complex transport system permease protein
MFTRERKAAVILSACALLVLVLLVSVATGAVSIPLSAVARILVSPLTGTEGTALPDTWYTIILRLRLPRALLAMQVGLCLAMAGGTMQGLFKNPLADPYIIGVSSGAAVGAALAIVMGVGWGSAGAMLLPLAAFAGALAALVLVYLLASRGGRLPVLNLLLAGIAVSTFWGSIVSLLMFFSGQQLQQVVFWLMGGFGGRSWVHVLVMLPYMVLGASVVLWHSRDLDALAMGEEQAFYMGVDVEKVKRRLLLAGSLLAAVAVAVSGLIGFVGLVVPHAIRLLGGPKHSFLLPTVAVAGAAYLAAADVAARVVMAPTELPVGLVTALVGGPFFLYLLRRRRTA